MSSRAPWADLEIGGHVIPEGHRVLLLLGAANRDPAVVDDPDHFDVGRRDVPLLSFAAGVHFCLGAALARLEAPSPICAPSWTPLDDEPPWNPRIGLRGLARPPVAFW